MGVPDPHNALPSLPRLGRTERKRALEPADKWIGRKFNRSVYQEQGVFTWSWSFRSPRTRSKSERFLTAGSLVPPRPSLLHLQARTPHSSSSLPSQPPVALQAVPYSARPQLMPRCRSPPKVRGEAPPHLLLADDLVEALAEAKTGRHARALSPANSERHTKEIQRSVGVRPLPSVLQDSLECGEKTKSRKLVNLDIETNYHSWPSDFGASPPRGQAVVA